MPKRRKSPPARRASATPDPTVVTGVARLPFRPPEVARRFRTLLADGAQLLPAGEARDEPDLLLTRRYLPRHEVELFDLRFFLTDFRFDEHIDFLIAYVGRSTAQGRVRRLYPRIFYRDVSLVWRAASHVCIHNGDSWIGKGDTKVERDSLGSFETSAEETTNLPFEMQGALDDISRMGRKVRDDRAVRLLLRNAPPDRTRAYADFTSPRERANASTPIHGGRRVARFTRRNDPTSLVFARGYEPDFRSGVLEVQTSGSRVYGGRIDKYRIRSTNRKIQYQFVASPTHVWINPPQALSTELLTYGPRTHDVCADDDLFVPGFEYHFLDDSVDPPEWHSQIPAGFAGEPSPLEPSRADASPWIEKLPVVREFRRVVLRQRARKS